MRRADSPITRGALDERKAVAWLEWDYAGPEDDGHPFEWKPSDWGYLDGRVVAIDYGATAFESRGQAAPIIGCERKFYFTESNPKLKAFPA